MNNIIYIQPKSSKAYCAASSTPCASLAELTLRPGVARITFTDMATITLRVPESMHKELIRQSAASGLSKSDLAREALSRYLNVGEFRRLRRKFVPLAQGRGIHTDEDVFKVI